MKVIRQGSRRSSSSSEIIRDKVPKVTWDSSRKSVALNVRNNPDGYGSQWDYWVRSQVSSSVAYIENTWSENWGGV